MKDHSPRKRTVVTTSTFGYREKANSDVTTRQMTPEEWARTDLFKPQGRPSVSIGNFDRKKMKERENEKSL